MQTKFKKILKAGYLYVVSGITLIMILIGLTTVVNNVVTYNILQVEREQWGQSPEQICTTPRTFTEGIKDVFTRDLTDEELDECIERETQNQKENAKIRYTYAMAEGLSLLIVALPFWIYHWSIIRKEEKTEDKK